MQTKSNIRRLILIAALVFVLAAFLTACGKGPPPGVKYHCPMHPTFISDKPGDCPICGMRLIPIEEKTAPTTVPAYVCPMHPEVTSDRAGERCSKCGMRLVPTGVTGDYPKEHKTYTCPMHPEFLTDDPNERCPKCGMKVVEKKAEDRGPGTGDISPTHAAGPHPEQGPRATGGERKVLFYRNPMNPKITSPVPMKDEMGMDYVPVYSDEAGPAEGGVAGMATVEISADGIRLSGVQTEPAVIERVARSVRTVATVTADETRIRHVHTKIAGWVEKLFVNFTGQLVRKGEPILSIYSQELLASQQEFLRARETTAKFAASELPEVRRGGEELLQSAEQRLRLFDVPEDFIEELKRTGQPKRAVTLLAPVSGFVTTKEIFEGQQIEPGMELFTITDLSRVWIEADFYEYEARALHVGQEAKVTLPYDPSRQLAGRVTYIYPTLNPESRTLRVRLEFPNPDFALKPAMFANVELPLDAAEGVVIPDSAVIDTGERQVVFVSQGGGRFEPREVRLGVRSSGRAQVLSGVAAGEQVVTRANFLLDSESQLRAAVAGMKKTSGHQHGGGQ
jgi:multidrug efflux pump subunit AcrA (membrane-fusion protein)/DNA-directed RNA polymerase subunit RPC12/RpoP